MALDSSSPDGKLRVLSLDGGGFRGLGALYAIDAIVKAANERNRKPTDTKLRPCDVFDFVLGASAGGLVAMLIGRLGLTCDEAIADYKTIATALFGTDRDKFTRDVLAGTKLDTGAYRTAIDAVISNRDTSGSSKKTNYRQTPPRTAKTAISIILDGKSTPQSVPSFQAGYPWSMTDLAQSATTATQYMDILTDNADNDIPGDGFIDVAYTGVPGINPTISVLGDIVSKGKLFDAVEVGVLVSMGQGFRNIQPLNATKTPVRSDTQSFQSTFLGGVSDDDGKVAETVLIYLKQAQVALKAWDTLSKRNFSAGSLVKLDPPSVPDQDRLGDLADIFHADKIKAQVEQWVKDNDSVIKQITEKLVKKKVNPLDPPPPPPGTRPYNPALDAAKPTDMLGYLSTYHVIFIVDDSTSMILEDDYSDWNDNRWKQAEKAIGPIAQFAYDNKVTNIDMGFMHYRRNSPVVGLQSQAAVEAAFRSAKPPQNWNAIQYTPTAATLDVYLKKAMDELDQTTDEAAYKKIRPTDIILLTDGEADDNPKASMQTARNRMDAGKHNHNYIGITIVQIGNSKKTAVKLADITNGACGDMANLIPSNGEDLDDKKLARILLGGIHPTVRRTIGNIKP